MTEVHVYRVLIPIITYHIIGAKFFFTGTLHFTIKKTHTWFPVDFPSTNPLKSSTPDENTIVLWAFLWSSYGFPMLFTVKAY